METYKDLTNYNGDNKLTRHYKLQWRYTRHYITNDSGDIQEITNYNGETSVLDIYLFVFFFSN